MRRRLFSVSCILLMPFRTKAFLSPPGAKLGKQYSIRSASTRIRASLSLKPYLERLISGKDLDPAETESAMTRIMQGEAVAEQVAALLCLLRMKGETAPELAGFVRGMKASCVPVNAGAKLLDIVGTGGDGADTMNISTASAILASAAGANVCKFGNRSVSSMCGSADVLEALGISVELTPKQVEECCKKAGIAFMYAPTHYPSMKNVAPVRKALGVRTVFNILGPMTNPAGAQHAVIGVFDKSLMPLMAGALTAVGSIKHAVIVHGCGLDEISPLGASAIIEIQNTAPEGSPPSYTTKEYVLDPIEYGFPKCTLADLKGGDRDTNARLLRETLEGGTRQDAKRDSIVLNAGMGVYVYGLTPTLKAGFDLARETLVSGKAIKHLDNWIETSKAVSTL